MRSLLIDGCRRSPTLRALIDALGRTDGVVYIMIGACPVRALRGCLLHTIHDTGNARYLWIGLNPGADPTELVGTMAHELQHALEVLEKTEVRSPRDVLDFYQSPESRGYSDQMPAGRYRTYETSAAIQVAAAVRAELTRSSGVVLTDDRH